MKDKIIDVAQVVELDVADLGDAAVETRQFSPAMHAPDNQYGWGEWAAR